MKIFIIGFLFFPFFLQKRTVHVVVKISAIKNGTKVYLKNDSRLDSAIFTSGSVNFDFEKAKPTPYQIVIYTPGRTLMIFSFIDDEDLSITGSLGQPYESYTYIGSKTQSEYLAVYHMVHGDEQAIKAFKANKGSKTAAVKIDSLENAIIQKQFSFSKENPHSAISPILLYGALKFKKVKKEQAISWYSMLGEDVKQTSMGKTVYENLSKY